MEYFYRENDFRTCAHLWHDNDKKKEKVNGCIAKYQKYYFLVFDFAK